MWDSATRTVTPFAVSCFASFAVILISTEEIKMTAKSTNFKDDVMLIVMSRLLKVK